MKYQCVNELDLFEYHDATSNFISVQGNVFEMHLENLNVHKMTKVNPGKVDLQIKLAVLKFTDCAIESYEPERNWKTNSKGELYTDELQIMYNGETALSRLIDNAIHRFTIIVFNTTEDNGQHTAVMSCTGNDPFFKVTFKFKNSTVEWDEYDRKAWYEFVHQYRPTMHISVLGIKQEVKAYLGMHFDDGGMIEAPLTLQKVILGLTVLGKEHFAEGETLEETLALLSTKVPKGIKILSLDEIQNP